MTCQTYELSAWQEKFTFALERKMGGVDPKGDYPDFCRLAPLMMSRIEDFLALSRLHRQEHTEKLIKQD
jgi:hypothetical protein